MAKPKQKPPETNVCGACDYCRLNPEEKESYLCWGNLPTAVPDGEGYAVKRAFKVGLTDPKCVHYTPRLNS
jgi:hypothetical protein